jgi:hypothetical protein
MKRMISLGVLFILFSQLALPLVAGITLPAGSRIQLRCMETISSESLFPGQNVRFRTVNDVVIDQKLLIASDTDVLARVVAVEPNGIVGKPGRFILQVDNVKGIDGTVIPITATQIVDGKGKVVESILVTLVLCIFGLFIKGGEATIYSGTIIEASTLADAVVETDPLFYKKEVTQTPKTVEVVEGMPVEVITTSGKIYQGQLSSKEDGKIFILNSNNLTVISLSKASQILEPIDKSNILDKVILMKDFEPAVKYNWNSLDVKTIE